MIADDGLPKSQLMEAENTSSVAAEAGDDVISSLVSAGRGEQSSMSPPVAAISTPSRQSPRRVESTDASAAPPGDESTSSISCGLLQRDQHILLLSLLPAAAARHPLDTPDITYTQLRTSFRTSND